MEQQKRQRSPWLYALLGCGGLAAAICIGFTVLFAVCANKAKNIGAGMSDPKVAEANAKEMLGDLPAGYYAVGSFDAFVMKVALLADEPPPADSNTPFAPKHRFQFVHVMANDNNTKAKAFFREDGKDTSVLNNSGLSIEPEDIVKRGVLTVGGRKIHYVVANGTVSTMASGNGAPSRGSSPEQHAGMHTAFLFDCPGEALDLGVWSMLRQEEATADAAVSLKGTIGDEAEMAQFLKPLKPCQ
jgi:hypothetical protein